MCREEDKLFVEAIKLAAGEVQYRGLPVSRTIVNAIKHLQDYYNGSKDIRYLEVALLYIQAYLEMGSCIWINICVYVKWYRNCRRMEYRR